MLKYIILSFLLLEKGFVCGQVCINNEYNNKGHNVPCLDVSAKVTGDPHYTTWDGKRFSFMGKCIYYLVKGNNFSIESDNYAWENGQYVKEETYGPSYSRQIVVRIGHEVVELKQNLEVSMNDVSVKRFPYEEGSILITKPSSSFVLVELLNKIQVQWDGSTTVVIRLPVTMKGKIRGLLGTYTYDQSDDFLTPAGEIVEDVVTFGNSWKVNNSCPDVPDNYIEHPCKVNSGGERAAKKICGFIKSDIFNSCQIEDVETDYENCVYDSCYCKENISKCACESIAAFADGCAKKGISIDWRKKLPECQLSCPIGEVYQVCNDGCSRTCEDISLRPECANVCIEGCNCAAGMTKNENGKCIPVEKCKCRINGVVYPPGYQFLKSKSELLTCVKAKWTTSLPNKEQLAQVPSVNSLSKNCDVNEFSVFTPCRYRISKTCQNMHNYQITTIDVCREGCECMEGYVFNSKRRTCVKPEDCPCYHNKRSYVDNSVIQRDSCNKCVCENGIWNCISENCQSLSCENENDVMINEYGKCTCKKGSWICSKSQCDLWGDSHVKTFDGLHYDFQSDCSFTLLKGHVGNKKIKIDFTNELCSHVGATCLKSIKIEVDVKDVEESVTLTKNQKLSETRYLRKLILTDKSLLVTIKVIGTEIEILWDKKTGLSVRLDDEWQEKVEGLCGNFNHLREDDIGSENIHDFVSMWKIDDGTDCEVSKLEARSTCDETRSKWAKRKCDVLLSDVFSPCHAVIPVNRYYNACLMDTCKCDIGGDCECLCTALSLYAQRCNYYSISINWRNQSLCPVQCFGNTQYYPCMSTCPPNTCETIQDNTNSACNEENTCVEGCGPKSLPIGRIYTDSTFSKHVPETSCTGLKCNINGNMYYDEETFETSCNLCYCSSGKHVCMKLPKCSDDPDSIVWDTATDVSETWETTIKPQCTCGCPPGYKAYLSGCVDINECSQYKPCGSLAQCINRKPGYECGPCPNGYQGNTGYFKQFLPEFNPDDTCVDIDECEENKTSCASDFTCRNIKGSYECIKCDTNSHYSKTTDVCVCNSGWIGNGSVCIDINECLNNNGNCSTNSLCVNLNGTYKCIKCNANARLSGISNECECDVGWAGDGTICGVDTDADGWPDNNLNCTGKKCKKDNCKEVPNPDQEDVDGDAVGDYCDDDMDNDGILNYRDNCPNLANANQADSDSDSVGDRCDNCPSNSNSDQEDYDNDGIGNVCDTDIDGDGIENKNDNCPKKSNIDQFDKDLDKVGDICDNCPLNSNPNQEDLDQDSVGDSCDLGSDIDSDGVKDMVDNCKFIANANQQDVDHDGLGDACDNDIDNDGILNDVDNCVLIKNPDQKDSNNNGKGDACENDADGDGIIDELDSCPKDNQIAKKNIKPFEIVNFFITSSYKANFIVYDKGAQIKQTVYNYGASLVGFDKFANVDYEGSIIVDAAAYRYDIGFVFSYQNNRKFYAIVWSAKGYGVQIKLANSATKPTENGLVSALYNAQTTANEVKLLWQDPARVGWTVNVQYHWKLIHRPKIGLIILKIYSGSKLIIDSGNILDSTLQGGRLGVFCNYQDKVVWSNLGHKCNDYVTKEIYNGLPSNLKGLIEVENS